MKCACFCSILGNIYKLFSNYVLKNSYKTTNITLNFPAENLILARNNTAIKKSPLCQSLGTLNTIVPNQAYGQKQRNKMTPLKLHSSNSIDIFSAETKTVLELPFVDEGISAGFPSPALDFIDISIDLNKHLIKHPSATFYGRVKGVSLINAGINDGDLLIIDRSLEPINDKIAVCYIDGEFTAKRIKITKNEVWLIPENEDYQPIKVTEDNNFLIWGIVTHVIKYV